MGKIKKITKIADAPDLHKGVFSFFTSLAIVLFAMFVMVGGLIYLPELLSGENDSGTGMGSSAFSDTDDSGTGNGAGNTGNGNSQNVVVVTPKQACQRIAQIIEGISERNPVWSIWAINRIMSTQELDEISYSFRVLCGDIV